MVSTAALKPRCRNTRRSTTGCFSCSSQIRKAAKPITATMDSTTICVEANQSRFLPSSSTSCSATTQITSRTRPTTSKGLRTVAFLVAPQQLPGVPAEDRCAIGALIRNTQCQLKSSTSQPPRIGPTTGATSVVIDHRPMAAPAFSFGKMRSSRVCDSGISGPPHSPWNTRATTSMPSEVARPQTMEKTPNRIMEPTNTRTEPKRAASQPVSGTVIASPTA